MMVRTRRKKLHQPSVPPAYPDPVQGPTPQAQAQQAYERRRLEVNGPRVFARLAASLLDVLVKNGCITKQQAQGGEYYATDHVRIWGSVSLGDSCVQRVGGVVHESEAQAEAIVYAKQRHNRILNRVGPAAYALLVQVAVFEEPLGRDRDKGTKLYALLRHALDAAAQVYGIPQLSD